MSISASAVAPLRATATAPADAPIIEAEGLAKAYGATAVFSDVSFRLAPGERVALIGANGAGKTTLLRCLIGLVAPSAGRLTVLGEPLSGEGIEPPGPAARARLRRQAGYVFQNHSLVRRRSALSNAVHGLIGQPGGWRCFSEMTAPAASRAAAMAALADVRLADKATERVDRLSGGQAQRVAIARALVSGPRLMIADEPTASLDPAAGREVMALFDGLVRQRGIALLYTSHDMAEALAHSDRIVALRGGRVVIDRASADLTPADLGVVFDG
ncbi:MAG: ATP-binding cassette domain-containing protein [Pseudomonadota bacterium]